VTALIAIGGVGGVLGGALSGWIARKVGDARLLWMSGAAGVGFLAMQAAAEPGPALAWFVVGQFGLSMAIAAFNVAARAGIQRSAPPHALGRVTASIRLFSRGALPLGAVIGGVLATAYAPRAALWLVVAGYLVMPVWLRLSPIGRVRTIGRAPAPEGRPRAKPAYNSAGEGT
jgi:MFS family permease